MKGEKEGEEKKGKKGRKKEGRKKGEGGKKRKRRVPQQGSNPRPSTLQPTAYGYCLEVESHIC